MVRSDESSTTITTSDHTMEINAVNQQFFSCSANIPRGLSAYKPYKLVVYCSDKNNGREDYCIKCGIKLKVYWLLHCATFQYTIIL